jgi:hypothetical protein
MSVPLPLADSAGAARGRGCFVDIKDSFNQSHKSQICRLAGEAGEAEAPASWYAITDRRRRAQKAGPRSGRGHLKMPIDVFFNGLSR